MVEVKIEPYALAKIMQLLQECDTEFGFRLIGEIEKKEYGFLSRLKKFLHKGTDIKRATILDIFVPEQKASSAYFEATEEGHEQIANVDENFIGWGHSHGSMNAFHSSTDKETAEAHSKIKDDSIISLTVSEDLKGWDCKVFENGDGKKVNLKFMKLNDILHKIKEKKFSHKVRQGRRRTYPKGYRTGPGIGTYARKTRESSTKIVQDEKLPDCPRCGRNNDVHDANFDDKDYYCGYCGKRFNAGEGDNPACPECRADEGDKLACPDCGAGPEELKAKKTGYYDYVCENCGKEFREKNSSNKKTSHRGLYY